MGVEAAISSQALFTVQRPPSVSDALLGEACACQVKYEASGDALLALA